MVSLLSHAMKAAGLSWIWEAVGFRKASDRDGWHTMTTRHAYRVDEPRFDREEDENRPVICIFSLLQVHIFGSTYVSIAFS